MSSEAEALDSYIDFAAFRSELKAVIDKIEKDLKNSVLIANHAHVLENFRSEIKTLTSRFIKFRTQIRVVDGQTHVPFLSSFGNQRLDFVADLSKLKLLLFDRRLLLNLISGEGEKVVQKSKK
jgi:hypothetical protein